MSRPSAVIIDFMQYKYDLAQRASKPERQAEPFGYDPVQIEILATQCQRGDDDIEQE